MRKKMIFSLFAFSFSFLLSRIAFVQGGSDGRRVVAVGSNAEKFALPAKIQSEATRKGKDAQKALDRFNRRYEIVVSAPRKVFNRTFQNGKNIVDERQIDLQATI
jgi:hypothetical protein